MMRPPPTAPPPTAPRPTAPPPIASPPQPNPDVLEVVLGDDPVTLSCPKCHVFISTATQKEVTKATHLWALICLCCSCCCLPYCSDCLKRTKHYCPNCKETIGYAPA